MTLIIGVATGSGIVMASDSRTTVLPQGPGGPGRVISDSSRKLVLVQDTAISTAGWAFLSRQNIASHLADFEADLKANPAADVNETAQRLHTFFDQRLQSHIALTGEQPPAGRDVLTFLVGGYEDKTGRVLEVGLPVSGVKPLLDTDTNCGYAVRGQTDVFHRLIQGVDLERLGASAAAAGKQQSYLDLQPELEQLEYRVQFPLLNVQDAIDFAVLAIRTTADVHRLTFGTRSHPWMIPGVGGPIELVALGPSGCLFRQATSLQGERPAGQAEAP